MKAKNVFTWLCQLVLGAIFLMAGGMKLANDPDSIQLFRELGMEPAGRYLTGILEIVAAGMLVRASTAARGALLSLCIMLGAFIAHATRIGFTGEMSELALMWSAAFTCSCLVLVLRRRDLQFLTRALER